MTMSTFWKDQIKSALSSSLPLPFPQGLTTLLLPALAINSALELPLIAGLLKIIHYVGQDAILRIVAYAILGMYVRSSTSHCYTH
jgi:hypothetical protein